MSAAPDDGVRCGEWSMDGFDLEYTHGRRAATVEQLGSDTFKVTLSEATFNPDSKLVSCRRRSIRGAQLSAERWILERYPHAFDDRPKPTTDPVDQ